MRILAIYRHYWPDTAPYSRILQQVLEHLASEGNSTTIFTSQPSYNDLQQPRQPVRENLNNVDVKRITLMREKKEYRIRRAANFLYFLFFAVAHCIRHRSRYDVVIANTHPPILMGCTLRLIRWLTGLPYIYHLQDIHPECAHVAGQLKRGWIYQRLRAIDASNCGKARQLVVLSHDMVKSLEDRGLSTDRVTVLNNPPQVTVDRQSDEPSVMFRQPSEKACFLFAGNLGTFQGLERVVDAIHCLGDRFPVNLVFMGEGSAKRRLMERSGQLLDKSIFFLPHQPLEIAQAAMRAADFGIVSLLPNLYRYAYPSKSMTYLSAGCPIIAIVEQESELAATVQRNNLGYVVKNGTPAAIASTLSEAVDKQSQWTAERRMEVAKVCEEIYGSSRMRREWSKLLDEFMLPTKHRSLANTGGQAA